MNKDAVEYEETNRKESTEKLDLATYPPAPIYDNTEKKTEYR